MTGFFRDRTIRLAVTGLSGSGKTAFITSLVENLISVAGGAARLPFLRAAAEGRLVEGRVRRPKRGMIPPFPLTETVAALTADPPRWPPSTTDLRQVNLSLRFFPAGWFGYGHTIGLAASATAELSLQILDYPGEWLLDLPLLGQSYQEWSRATLDLVRGGPRAHLAGEWLNFLAGHPATSRSDAETARQAHSLYQSFLAACRNSPTAELAAARAVFEPGDPGR